MIDITNYEGYLYLWHEGELSPQESKEVESFLAAHPDIKSEMEQYYDPELVVTAEAPVCKKAIPIWRWTAAACALLAVGGAAWWAMQDNTEQNNAAPMVAKAITVRKPKSEPITQKAASASHPIYRSTSLKPNTISDIAENNVVISQASIEITDDTLIETMKEETFTSPTNHVIIDQVAIADEVIYVNFLAEESESLPDPIPESNFSLFETLASAFERECMRGVRLMQGEMLAMNNE